MSDQYTRVTSGGSLLDKDAPVVGLLFGTVEEEEATVLATDDRNDTTSKKKTIVQILDAEDIPPQDPKPQIKLHRAVFPQHQVVGWYRVAAKNDAEPTMQDLETTQSLAKEMLAGGEAGDDDDAAAKESQVDHKFLFCLLQLHQTEDELPLVLFELDSSTPGDGDEEGGSVLVATDPKGWKVETSPAEKIAVEKVVRELPHRNENSAFLASLSSMQEAVGRMKERLELLTRFLQDTVSGEYPYNHTLMRQVYQLVCQLGPLLASAPTTASSSSVHSPDEWMLHLAVTTKTLRIVHEYTEKFKLVQENKANNPAPASAISASGSSSTARRY